MLQLPTAETFFGPRLRRKLGQTVTSSDTAHGDERWRQLAADTGLPICYWAFHLYGDDTLAPPDVTDETAPLVVHVRHGRWLAVCECGSCQHASTLDRRFYCVSCRNSIVDGRLRTVVWPKNPEAIEHALRERPQERRHWLPHETVADLQAQTGLLAAMAGVR